MSRDAVIARARRRIAALFDAECTITADSSGPVFDPVTGTYSDPQTSVYSGPCNVHFVSASEREAGEQERAVLGHVAVLPADTAVERGQTLTVTAASHDADLVGQVFTVTDVGWTAWQLRRLASLEIAT